MRRYADLVRQGPQTAGARLALLREHRAAVAERIGRLRADLDIIDYKITTYQGMSRLERQQNPELDRPALDRTDLQQLELEQMERHV